MKTAPPTHLTIEHAVKEFVATARSMPLENISLNQSLFHDLSIDGDDAFDLVEKFSVRFMSAWTILIFRNILVAKRQVGP